MQQIEKGKVYDFKKEFWALLNIKRNAWEARKDELLEWLDNFFDYELYEGRPMRIYIKEIYGEYRPLPRKINNTELTIKKAQDYEKFAIASLGNEFKPNSKAKTAREAIDAFGYEKYGHTNTEAVTKRFVSPVFDTYGESNGVKHWVWYHSYEPLDEETLARWREIMAEEHISEREAANAFYRQENGEDISQEKKFFANARARFKEEFGSTPILVADWRLKAEVQS